MPFYPLSNCRKGDDRLHLLAVTEIFLLILVAYIIQEEGEVLEESVDIALSVLLITLTILMVRLG